MRISIERRRQLVASRERLDAARTVVEAELFGDFPDGCGDLVRSRLERRPDVKDDATGSRNKPRVADSLGDVGEPLYEVLNEVVRDRGGELGKYSHVRMVGTLDSLSRKARTMDGTSMSSASWYDGNCVWNSLSTDRKSTRLNSSHA